MYRLSDERGKAELLRDLLAFANANAQADAYILLGVDEVAGRGGTAIGIGGHFDDASLQQLVEGKTNRAVEFAYHEVEIDGNTVGVLTVSSCQRHPLYLRRECGHLRANVVYLRRGTTTAEMTPDELVQTFATPPLKLDPAQIQPSPHHSLASIAKTERTSSPVWHHSVAGGEKRATSSVCWILAFVDRREAGMERAPLSRGVVADACPLCRAS